MWFIVLSLLITLLTASLDNGMSYAVLWSVGVEPRLFFGFCYSVGILLPPIGVLSVALKGVR